MHFRAVLCKFGMLAPEQATDSLTGNLALWTFPARNLLVDLELWCWSVGLLSSCWRREFVRCVQGSTGKMATINLGDQMALFNQYDSEYCTKATDVARKVQAVSSLGSGWCPLLRGNTAGALLDVCILVFGFSSNFDLVLQIRAD